MSRKNISYVKGYEHSDFTDLLNELQGKKQNIEMADGALALDAPSSTESVCSYEEWLIICHGICFFRNHIMPVKKQILRKMKIH